MMLRLLLCFLVASTALGRRKPYSNYSVLEITPADEDQYRFLLELYKDPDLDFWRGPLQVGSSSHVMIPPDRRRDIEETLSNRGIRHSVVINDVQVQIDEERRSMESSRKKRSRTKRDNPLSFFLNYHNIREINDYLDNMQAQHPRIITNIIIGRTYKKQKLRVIKIGNEKKMTKPAIWIDACIHAREWISASTALYLIHQLVTQYDSNDVVKELVNNYNWYIMPVANPDGYRYTHEKKRLWRKNLNPIPGSPYVGVDLNRNFEYMWNTSSNNTVRQPKSSTYQGPHAFSEAESTAIANFLRAQKEYLKVYFSLHSYGPYWLTPYGEANHIPRNFAAMKDLANLGVTAMASYKGTTMPITPAFSLYPATGISIDWVHALLHVNYAYTLELATEEFRFETPKEKIMDIGEEVWLAMKAISSYLIGE